MQFQGRSEETYVPLIQMLSASNGRQGASVEAFELAERAKSRAFIELLSRRRIARPSCLGEELAAREEDLLHKIVAMEEAEEVGSEVARRHAELSEELDALWRGVAAIDPACADYVDLRRITPVSYTDIVALLDGGPDVLPADTAIQI
jgi:hypothetical protein